MARPYRPLGRLVTRRVDGTSWHLVDGIEVAYAPEALVPLGLDEGIEYRAVFDHESQRWEVYGRAAAGK